jgi:hypothetical protein
MPFSEKLLSALPPIEPDGTPPAAFVVVHRSAYLPDGTTGDH